MSDLFSIRSATVTDRTAQICATAVAAITAANPGPALKTLAGVVLNS